MFKKLAFTLPPLDLDKIKGEIYEDHYGKLIMYDLKDSVYLNELIAGRIEFKIAPSKIAYVEIPDSLGPHTDGYVSMSLNYIIEDSACVTCFWKPKTESIYAGQNVKIINDGSEIVSQSVHYQLSDLQLVSSFKSGADEAWLLDVREIHSVIKPSASASTVRKMITWRWDPKYSFEEIKNSIKLLDNSNK